MVDWSLWYLYPCPTHRVPLPFSYALCLTSPRPTLLCLPGGVKKEKGSTARRHKTIGSHAVVLPWADMSFPISVRRLIDHDALAVTGSGNEKVGRQPNEINRIIFILEEERWKS